MKKAKQKQKKKRNLKKETKLIRKNLCNLLKPTLISRDWQRFTLLV